MNQRHHLIFHNAFKSFGKFGKSFKLVKKPPISKRCSILRNMYNFGNPWSLGDFPKNLVIPSVKIEKKKAFFQTQLEIGFIISENFQRCCILNQLSNQMFGHFGQFSCKENNNIAVATLKGEMSLTDGRIDNNCEWRHTSWRIWWINKEKNINTDEIPHHKVYCVFYFASRQIVANLYCRYEQKYIHKKTSNSSTK